MIDALLEAWGLKALPRAGWGQRGLPNAESVAAHSWGVATLVLLFLPPELGRERALSYAVLHDLPEARVGDLTPRDGVAPTEKHQREQSAMRALAEALPNGHTLLALWTAYEAQDDEESRFVRQLDRLDMALQALVYEGEHSADLSEFFDSAATVITHPALLQALDAIRAARSGDGRR